jgi:hypothetical protein
MRSFVQAVAATCLKAVGDVDAPRADPGGE